MAYTIMLDAGHGGADFGATNEGRREKDDVLALTLAIGSILEENGVNVLYTRTTDIYETPTAKALEAMQQVLIISFPFIAIPVPILTNIQVLKLSSITAMVPPQLLQQTSIAIWKRLAS